MIKQTLNDFLRRDDPVSRLVAAFFERYDLLTAPEGRYELSGGAYVSVQQYMTCRNDRFEAHRRFIDIQLLASGAERILTAPLDSGVAQAPYNEEKDVAFYRCSGDISAADLAAEDLVILFPEDLHAPSNCISEPAAVRKLLFKIPVSVWHGDHAI